MSGLRIPGFTADEVARAVEIVTDTPQAGRWALVRELGLSERRARRLARDVKSLLGVGRDLPRPIAHAVSSTADRISTIEVDESPKGLKASGDVSAETREGALERLLAEAGVDLETWEVDRWKAKRYEGFGKTGSAEEGWSLETVPMWSVSADFKRRETDVRERMIEEALVSMRAESPKVSPVVWTPKVHARRALEISVMDPHLGGLFFEPGSDGGWTLEDCRRLFLFGIREVLERAAPFGPFERILFPTGNDFMHVDNVWHTTTGGTPQPEAVSWQHTVVYGERLLIDAVTELRQHAPHVDVPIIPGNHGRQTEFLLGRILLNRFWGDEAVHVDASAEPYKAWHYGRTLLAFEHGHSVRPPIRLAALMAQTWPDLWFATDGGFREWHLGDQHRKGSAKPTTLEEQGVSVEYLPGLTPGNEWHKIKSFNNQKRVAATGFVWDYDAGPWARLPIAIDSRSGLPMGRAA